jgi:hypothetical protein
MTKKDKEQLEKGAVLVSEMSGFLAQLYERLYQRAGDAWQFKEKVDDLQARSAEFVQGVYPPKVAVEPEPVVEEEPTVGFEDEE